LYRKYFILLFINYYFTTFSPERKFSNDFDFLSFTIKDTYAGYRDKVKGNEFDALVKRLKQSRSKDTFALLSQMTAFFKDNHVLVYDDSIRYRKIDTLQCKKDSQMLQQYLANKKPKAAYEGYWLNDYDYCVVALRKVKSNPVTYYGYVMETKTKAIPGYCILKMTQQKDGTYYTDYIMENLRIRAFVKTIFKNRNVFWVSSFGKWKRLPKYESGVLTNLATFSFKPAFTMLDSNTMLLKMADFSAANISRYDSIIKANKTAIDRSTTLIIDIRNNPGGYVNSYLPLLPYIYTGPIVHSGGYTLVSKNYIKQYDDKIKKFEEIGDTANATIYINYRDSILAQQGQLVYRAGDTLAQDLPVLSNPKNIAIIINHNCASSAELMLQNFRQSRKVKFFGENTGGAVDYLNVMSFRLPYSKYSLSVASVKRALNEREPSYDGKGIPPDVQISDDVIDWVAFVKKYYDEHQ
jgi:Peptidase family S41